ncbi:SIS domain-containing protein [Schaalia sp. ZJ405]|uniref:6-phospho-3-hexuloisomerase n=1 Tax=unclassified Schaalia TaxID=2691889 RepID=UPI0013ED0E64|nr:MULTISPECIES: 6-phospho-3-hexuloisomerase [unclassified Schaalia]QPK81290.1 SIS domain-containing protein [Schaalia sp. ZJ405]
MSFAENSQTIVSELSEVMQRVSSREVVDLRRAILGARRVIVIGVGREGLAARAFTMRLAHAGIDSHWIWDDTTPSLTADDLLIAVSGSGEIGHIDYVVSRAEKIGAQIAVVTANPQGKTALRAQHIVTVPAAAFLSSGDMVESIQPMGSLFEQSVWLMFDCVILDIEEAEQLDHADLVDRHRNLE